MLSNGSAHGSEGGPVLIWIAGLIFLTAVVTAIVVVLVLRSQTRTENILQLLAERDVMSAGRTCLRLLSMSPAGD